MEMNTGTASTLAPTLPRQPKDHGNGPMVISWGQHDHAVDIDQSTGWKPKAPRTDLTLLDVFGTDDVIIDNTGAAHTDPACEWLAVEGERGRLARLADGFRHICWSCPLEDLIPRNPGKVTTDRDLVDRIQKAGRRSKRAASKTMLRPEYLPTDAEIEGWLRDLGRKVVDADVTLERNWAATIWAASLTATTGFLGDMAHQASTNLAKNFLLTPRQARAVLNCWRGDVLDGVESHAMAADAAEQAGEDFTPPAPAAPVAPVAPVEAGPIDLRGLPTGSYTLTGGQQVYIDHAKGSWAGWTFVSAGGYGSERYGKQRPGGGYEGRFEAELRALVAAGAPKVEAPKATAPAVKGSGLDLTDVPSGWYADPEGDANGSRARVRINHARNGTIYVDNASAYAIQNGAPVKLGRQAPGGTYTGKYGDILARIAADPKAAAARYGQITGKCGRCHRRLEDAASIARGLGPYCANQAY